MSGVRLFGRLALFVVYFWFGVLKVVTESPANPLVEALLKKTLPFVSFDQFIVGFGMLEMVIGILFLFPWLTKWAVGILLLHMVTTVLPMFLLPSIAWHAWFVPTLEGQYVIKNLVIIALALSLLPDRQWNSRIRLFS